MREGRKERAQRSSVGIESLRLTPECKEHLLGYLLGERAVPGDTAGNSTDDTGVTPVRLVERLLPEARDAHGERGVARVFVALHVVCFGAGRAPGCQRSSACQAV